MRRCEAMVREHRSDRAESGILRAEGYIAQSAFDAARETRFPRKKQEVAGIDLP